MSPSWEKVAPAIAAVTAQFHLDPKMLFQADQLGAVLRDVFDTYDICLADDQAVYTALVTMSIFAMFAAQWGDEPEALFLAKRVGSFTCALVANLPEEAGR